MGMENKAASPLRGDDLVVAKNRRSALWAVQRRSNTKRKSSLRALRNDVGHLFTRAPETLAHALSALATLGVLGVMSDGQYYVAEKGREWLGRTR